MKSSQPKDGNDLRKSFLLSEKRISRIVFLLAFISTGIAFSLPALSNAVFGVFFNSCLVIFVLSFIAAIVFPDRWGYNAFAVGLSLPVMNLFIIIYDSVTEKMEHSLFPIELFMTIIFASLSSYLGGIIGLGLTYLFKKFRNYNN